MRGILVREFGGPEVCKYETNISIPEPNDDQVVFPLINNYFTCHFNRWYKNI